MRSIHENEDLAKSIGVAATKYYVLAFSFACALVGFSGALYAHHFRFVNPNLLGLDYMFIFLIVVLVGGTGTLWGPVLGAAIFVLVSEWLRALQEYRFVIFGVVLLLVVLFMPIGVFPALQKAFRRRRERRESGDEAPAEGEEHALRRGGGGVAMPILETTGLTRMFGGLSAVDELDISVEEGEIRGLIGPNGSGKTTALNLITGYIKPTRGVVQYQGSDVSGEQPHELARLGLVRTFQITTLFENLTVRDNVLHGSHLNNPTSLFGASDTVQKVQASRARPLRTESTGNCWRSWASPSGSTRWPGTFRRESTGIWRSPSRWRPGPRCCSWTNRPPASTPRRPPT